jgi:uncharacterized protein
MLDDLFDLSRFFLRTYNREYKRYFLKKYSLENRLNIIIGQRGVGKTTAIIQYIFLHYEELTYKALYIPVDHFIFGKRTLYETAEEFFNLGGELLCFDEIHKYHGWSLELKSIYDSFPTLKIIASVSSAIEIKKESHDLSRRAIVHKMLGLSFREYIDLILNLQMESFSLEQILKNHEKIASNIVKTIENKNNKILNIFKTYLHFGYYPYFLEFTDMALAHIALEHGIHITIENDLLAVHPSLNGISIKKIKKLLSAISESVPFTPDLKRLKNALEIGDERTLKNYLKFLEDGGIILMFSKKSSVIKELEKPEKIYLNNTNQIYAISPRGKENIGNIRETFFVNMLLSFHSVTLPKHGDFLINDSYTFEIGGKNKGFSQIRNLPNSFLALDDVEIGVMNKIPIWLFGFLY